MADIYDIFRDQRRKFEDVKRTAFDGGGGGGYDDSMLERVEKLEKLVENTAERVVNIERDVAVIKSNYAIGKDVSDAKNSIIMWVVGTIFVAQLLPMLKDFVKPSAPSAPAAQQPAPAAAPAQARPTP
jgi:hypothetical protein